jgi:hypothetical protein
VYSDGHQLGDFALVDEFENGVDHVALDVGDGADEAEEASGDAGDFGALGDDVVFGSGAFFFGEGGEDGADGAVHLFEPFGAGAFVEPGFEGFKGGGAGGDAAEFGEGVNFFAFLVGDEVFGPGDLDEGDEVEEGDGVAVEAEFEHGVEDGIVGDVGGFGESVALGGVLGGDAHLLDQLLLFTVEVFLFGGGFRVEWIGAGHGHDCLI